MASVANINDVLEGNVALETDDPRRARNFFEAGLRCHGAIPNRAAATQVGSTNTSCASSGSC
jgi:hypothetical protein